MSDKDSEMVSDSDDEQTLRKKTAKIIMDEVDSDNSEDEQDQDQDKDDEEDDEVLQMNFDDDANPRANQKGNKKKEEKGIMGLKFMQRA